jgi:hypothetical protein
VKTLKDANVGDVVVITAKVVEIKNGQVQVEYGSDGKKWSMVNSIGATIIRPNMSVEVDG